MEIQIDGGARLRRPTAPRDDTVDTLWRRRQQVWLHLQLDQLGDGSHNLRAFADGVEFANVNLHRPFTLGVEYLEGLAAVYPVELSSHRQ